MAFNEDNTKKTLAENEMTRSCSFEERQKDPKLGGRDANPPGPSNPAGVREDPVECPPDMARMVRSCIRLGRWILRYAR